MRDVQQRIGDDLGIDADAYGYVLLAPLIYVKLIEWASHRRPLDIGDDELIETWATVMEPSLRRIVEAAHAVGQRTPSRGRKETGSKPARPGMSHPR